MVENIAEKVIKLLNFNEIISNENKKYKILVRELWKKCSRYHKF